VARASPAILSFPAAVLSQSASAYQQAFDALARDFMLDYDLWSAGRRLELLEIELYYRSLPPSDPAAPSHVDLFAHAHPIQKDSFGRWYWHRQGQRPDASYKGGNYKGLDVTFGPAGGGGHGGILIRSVRTDDGRVIEGSCLVAEEVLRHHRASSIEQVVSSWQGNLCAFTNPTLFFTPKLHASNALSTAGATNGPPRPRLIKSPRVGLTLKQTGSSRPEFIMKAYRYSRLPFFNRKQKQTIVLSVFRQLGMSRLDEICSLCDCTRTYLDRVVSAFEAGRRLSSMDSFVQHAKSGVSADGLAKMYGAWTRHFGDDAHVALL